MTGVHTVSCAVRHALCVDLCDDGDWFDNERHDDDGNKDGGLRTRRVSFVCFFRNKRSGDVVPDVTD